MATIINDKDKILQAATVRLPAVLGNGIYFSTPAPVFKMVGAVSTPTSYAITAKFFGQLTGTVTWSVVSGTVATTGQSGNTWTITPAQLTTDSAVIRATLVYLGTTYTSDFTISKIVDGSSAVNVVLSNESFVFTASSTGAISSYVGSGITVRVYEGSTELVYDGIGTANSSWTLSSTATGITRGTIVDSGTFATVGNASGMADATDTASIIYTVTGKTSAGVAFSLTKTQNFSKSKTGATGTGTNGANGLSTLVAYKVQNQSVTTAPTFTTTTAGAAAPTGWTLTAPSPVVGEVVWYINGRYNSSTVTIDGVTSGTTAWTGPVAASVFQDIRSDNWNGGTGGTGGPPTYTDSATWGSAGYYLDRNDGTLYINNGVFRGNINSGGDAKFTGSRGSGLTVSINGTARNIDYTTYAANNFATTGIVGVGHLGTAASATSQFNIGLLGIGTYGSQGIGVMGSGDLFGGYFTGPTALGLRATGTTNRALEIQSTGTFVWNGYTIAAPTGATTTFLRNDGTWAAVAGGGGGTVTSVGGTGSVSGLTLSGTVTSTGNLTLGGTLSVSQANLTASAPGAAYYLRGSGWTSTDNIMAGAGTNSGTALVSSNVLNFYTGTGLTAYQFVGSGNTVTLQSVSDKRLKENILPEILGLEFINLLKPVQFNRIGQTIKHHGFLADDLQKLVPDTTDSFNQTYPDGTKGLDYIALLAPLVKAVQELTAKVSSLEQQLQAVK